MFIGTVTFPTVSKNFSIAAGLVHVHHQRSACSRKFPTEHWITPLAKGLVVVEELTHWSGLADASLVPRE